MAAPFCGNGMRVIAVSRPGYLGTPPETGSTPQAQADALAGLLDSLGIGSCAVQGHCAGGLVGYLFAARHPDRVRCLVAVSTPTDPDVGASPAPRRLALSGLGVSLILGRDRRLLRRSGEAASRRMIGDDSTLDGTPSPRWRTGSWPTQPAPHSSPRCGPPAPAAARTGSLARASTRSKRVCSPIRRWPLSPTPPWSCMAALSSWLSGMPNEQPRSPPGAELRVITDDCHHGLCVNDDAAEQKTYRLDWLRAHAAS